MAKTKPKTAVTSISLVTDKPIPFIGGTYKTGLCMSFSHMPCGQVMLTMFVCDENGAVEELVDMTLTESATRQFEKIPVLVGDQIKVRIQPDLGLFTSEPVVGIAVERVPGAEIGAPFVKLQAKDLIGYVETLTASDAVFSSLNFPSTQVVSEILSYLILRDVISVYDIDGLAWSRESNVVYRKQCVGKRIWPKGGDQNAPSRIYKLFVVTWRVNRTKENPHDYYRNLTMSLDRLPESVPVPWKPWRFRKQLGQQLPCP